ncbi:MAG: nucleotidyltransferase [Terriglobales bacterium]
MHIKRSVANECKPLPVSSSTPPVFADEQRRLFREVLELFNQRHIPCVVSGAFALQKHTGIWRDTKDLDLFLPPEDAALALRALAEDGFETQIADPVWLAKAHRGEFYVDLITGMSNAVVTVDRSWIERGAPTEILGVPTRVLGAEELIASKLFVTRRERFDGADICHVIFGTRGHLDWQRLRQLVAGHDELLLWALLLYAYVYPSCVTYVPRELWDSLLEGFRRRMDRPDPNALFRGSLIDPNMFAIDVEEWGMHDMLQKYRDQRVPKIGHEQAA